MRYLSEGLGEEDGGGGACHRWRLAAPVVAPRAGPVAYGIGKELAIAKGPRNCRQMQTRLPTDIFQLRISDRSVLSGCCRTHDLVSGIAKSGGYGNILTSL